MEYYDKVSQEYRDALLSRVYFPVIKVELMDYGENVFAELQQDISAQDSGSISVNYQQGVRRSCSLTLINIDGEYLPSLQSKIWINSKFKVYNGIRIPATYTYPEEDYYWFSQGVFVLTDPVANEDLSNRTITLNGVDKFGMLGSETNFTQTEGTYLIEAGTEIGEVIKTILNENMGNGYPFDVATPIIDPTVAKNELPYELKKAPDEYFADIIIEMANMFDCDVFYDTNGRFNFMPTSLNNERLKDRLTISGDDNASLWDYEDVFTDYGSLNNQYSFTEVYNMVTVVSTHPNYDTFEATVSNNLPSSPVAIQVIGKKRKYIESSQCYNQDTVNNYALYQLRKLSIVQQSLTFNSIIIPHLDVNLPITIQDKHFGYEKEKYIIQSLSFPISSTGQVSVTASNVANIPYLEY